MNLIWHIIRKDLLRFRFILVGWVLLLGGKYLFLSAITGVFGHPSLYWIRQFEFPAALFFADPALVAYFLVAALVFEDPPAGRDPFWITRPISGVQLFTAKFLLAVLMFVAVPLLVALPWWWACGFGATEIMPLVGILGAAYLTVVLLGLAMASLTGGYPRYFVWTLAALAVVIGLHLAPLVFGGPGTLSLAFSLAVLTGCIAILSFAAAWQRFVVRHFGKFLPAVAAVVLVASVCFHTSPPAPVARLFSSEAPMISAEENVRVTIAGDVRTFLKGGLSLPLRIEGLPENSVSTVWMTATWRTPDGKTRRTRGSSGGNLQPLRRAAWRLLNLPSAQSQSSLESVNFALAPKYADLIASEAASVEGNVRINSSPARLVGEVPVGPGSHRFAGGSFTVSDYTVTPGELSFVFTVRAPHSIERWRGIGYLALLNRRTGELIEPAMQDQRTGGTPMTSDVAVITVGLRFKLPDAQWLNHATLVLVGFGSGREANLVAATYVRPANHAPALLPAAVRLPADIMKQYLGTYRPRPGATLVIREKHGDLELHDKTGFFRMVMMPESVDHFYAPNQNWLFAGDAGFHVEFVRDARGAVTHFVVHQDGRDFIVPRLPDPK